MLNALATPVAAQKPTHFLIFFWAHVFLNVTGRSHVQDVKLIFSTFETSVQEEKQIEGKEENHRLQNIDLMFELSLYFYI